MPRKKKQLSKSELSDVIVGVAECMANDLDLMRSVSGSGKSETQPPPITVGDIVQIVTKGHQFIARVGIVHHEEGSTLVCYQPGKKGFPHKFRVDTKDVIAVGKAHLKYSRPLPEDAVYADNSLDKI